MTDSRFTIPTVYAGLVAKVQEIITDCATISPELEYITWDARQDLNTELPNKDLIGIADYTFDEAEHFPEIEMLIMLSVFKDANLFREMEIAGIIHRHCVHKKRPEYLTWTLKDENNDPFSQLTVTGFTMLPSGQSEARTVRQFGISLKRADFAE